MPRVFISYTKGDDEIVAQLHKRLEDQGVAVWRDQASLYGGDAWPKALGEAVRDHDFFLLCWSERAKDSHFVEREWNTAVALKKPIIPYFLDETPLPAVLSSINGVRTEGEILTALEAPIPRVGAEEQGRVVRELGAVKETDPFEVAKVIRATFFQPVMNVQGTVIQVAGDYVAGTTEPALPEKPKPLEKWQTWATLIVALLTTTTLLLDVPEKLANLWQREDPSDAKTYTVTGIIREEGTPYAIEDVVVRLLDVAEVQPETTDASGVFRFELRTSNIQVELEGIKEGYAPLREDPMLVYPETKNTYHMRRSP